LLVVNSISSITIPGINQIIISIPPGNILLCDFALVVRVPHEGEAGFAMVNRDLARRRCLEPVTAAAGCKARNTGAGNPSPELSHWAKVGTTAIPSAVREEVRIQAEL